MGGWKTRTGGILFMIGQVMAVFMPAHPEYGTMVQAAGTSLAAVGIGHKIDKATNNGF